MDLKFYIEKFYSALIKRFIKQKEKNYADWLNKGYINDPQVSFIIQSHNKSESVKQIINQLRKYPRAEIIVIDDGSAHKHTQVLTRYLNRGNEFLIRANDLYENVMYDKAIRFANGKYLILLQDDDIFEDLMWIDKGIELFQKYPRMVILGGLDGLDFVVDRQTKKGDCVYYKESVMGDSDFKFVHIVNRSPMLLDKSLFEKKLEHMDFAYAPFMYDDCEICLRAWTVGLEVGWYKVKVNSLSAGGMRIWNNTFTQYQGEKNSRKLYEKYEAYLDQISIKVNESNNNM